MISISLESKIRRIGLSVALVLTASSLLVSVLRFDFAANLGRSTRVSVLERAATLDPANPKLRHRLGWLEFTSHGMDGLSASAAAIQDLRRATELAPSKSSYWADLARACEFTGDRACSSQALATALSLNPMTPRLHWVTANYDVRAGDVEGAIGEFRKVLSLDPEYAQAIFQVGVRVIGDPDLVWQRIIPENLRPQLDVMYATFLCEDGHADVAARVWQRIVSAPEPFSLPDAKAYLERLISLQRYGDAETVWQELGRRNMIPPGEVAAGNLVYNGGFEQPSLDAGFDWHYSQPPYVVVDPAAADPHGGSRCLHVQFPVKHNEDYEPAYEFVPVEPGREYVLSAYSRSEDITSDSGLCLRVMDPAHDGDLDVTTEATIGTTPWHQISVKFVTGAATSVVRVSVSRRRSRSYPPDISGAFWLDDVSMRRTENLPADIAQK